MPKKDISDRKEKEKDWIQRNLELENTLGDIMLSEYLADRIRKGLMRKTEEYQHKAAGYYYRDDTLRSPSSNCEFQYEGKLLKLSIEVDELIPDPKSRMKDGLCRLARPFSGRNKTPAGGAEKGDKL